MVITKRYSPIGAMHHHSQEPTLSIAERSCDGVVHFVSRGAPSAYTVQFYVYLTYITPAQPDSSPIVLCKYQ